MQFPISIVLFIVFLVLKLTEVIDWSWWWITAPIWAPAGLLLIVQAISLVIVGLVARKSFRK